MGCFSQYSSHPIRSSALSSSISAMKHLTAVLKPDPPESCWEEWPPAPTNTLSPPARLPHACALPRRTPASTAQAPGSSRQIQQDCSLWPHSVLDFAWRRKWAWPAVRHTPEVGGVPRPHSRPVFSRSGRGRGRSWLCSLLKMAAQSPSGIRLSAVSSREGRSGPCPRRAGRRTSEGGPAEGGGDSRAPRRNRGRGRGGGRHLAPAGGAARRRAWQRRPRAFAPCTVWPSQSPRSCRRRARPRWPTPVLWPRGP
jgi:hypothetical protein